VFEKTHLVEYSEFVNISISKRSPSMLQNTQMMPIIDNVVGPAEATPIISNDLEMEEGN